MRIGNERWEELRSQYIWPVANALAGLEEMRQIGPRNTPVDPIQAAKDETRRVCMDYAISVVSGIVDLAPPRAPSLRESFIDLTKVMRDHAANALEDAATWVRNLEG